LASIVTALVLRLPEEDFAKILGLVIRPREEESG